VGNLGIEGFLHKAKTGKGKKKRVALTALMRKILVIANARLKLLVMEA
jgi:hypothetical protein